MLTSRSLGGWSIRAATLALGVVGTQVEVIAGYGFADGDWVRTCASVGAFAMRGLGKKPSCAITGLQSRNSQDRVWS